MYLEDYGLTVGAIDELQDFNKIVTLDMPSDLKKIGEELSSDSYQIRFKLHGKEVAIVNCTDMASLGYYTHMTSAIYSNTTVKDSVMSTNLLISMLENLIKNQIDSTADLQKVLCLLKNME